MNGVCRRPRLTKFHREASLRQRRIPSSVLVTCCCFDMWCLVLGQSQFAEVLLGGFYRNTKRLMIRSTPHICEPAWRTWWAVVRFPIWAQEMQHSCDWCCSAATRFTMYTQRLIWEPGSLDHGLNYQYLRRYLWSPGRTCLSSWLSRSHISYLAMYSAWWGGLRNYMGFHTFKGVLRTVVALNRPIPDNNRGDSKLASSSRKARYRYESLLRRLPFKVPKVKNPEV